MSVGQLLTAMSLEAADGQFEDLIAANRKVHQVTGLIGLLTREQVRPRPGRHGVINTSRYRDAEPIVITGTFTGDTSDDAWAEYNDIAAVCATAVDTDRALRWTGGSVLDLVETQVRLVSMQPPLAVGPDLIRYQLTLRASDPRSYAQTESVAIGDFLSASGGGKVYPYTYPRVYTPAGGGSAVFTVGGTDETPPVFRIYGYATAPRIVLVATGEEIRLTGEVEAGTYMEIDVNARTVRLEDGTLRNNLFDFANSTWFELSPGSHTIQMFASNFDAAAHVEVRWRNAYA